MCPRLSKYKPQLFQSEMLASTWMLNSQATNKYYLKNNNKDLPPNNMGKKVLTLDFRAVGRAFGVPSSLIKVFCDSISNEGNRGVPGGVKSLRQKKILMETNLGDSYTPST